MSACPWCNKRLATQADCDRRCPDPCDHCAVLCWSEYHDSCNARPEDPYAEVLSLRSQLSRALAVVEALPCCDDVSCKRAATWRTMDNLEEGLGLHCDQHAQTWRYREELTYAAQVRAWEEGR